VAFKIMEIRASLMPPFKHALHRRLFVRTYKSFARLFSLRSTTSSTMPRRRCKLRYILFQKLPT
jgi:hypothetical protein